MIPAGVEVFVGLDPVNMHWSFDRLAVLVEEVMHRDPRSAALFVFFNRRKTLVKALFADGTGLCVFYKRLDRGRFQLPTPVGDGRVVELSEEALSDLLDGFDVARPDRSRPTPGLN